MKVTFGCRVLLATISATALLGARLGSAQTASPTPSEAEQLQLHRYANVLTVRGITLLMPSEDCVQLVENALMQHQEVAASDEACHKVMLRALEIQRTVPDVPGVQAQPIPLSPGAANPNIEAPFSPTPTPSP